MKRLSRRVARQYRKRADRWEEHPWRAFVRTILFSTTLRLVITEMNKRFAHKPIALTEPQRRIRARTFEISDDMINAGVSEHDFLLVLEETSRRAIERARMRKMGSALQHPITERSEMKGRGTRIYPDTTVAGHRHEGPPDPLKGARGGF